NGFNEVMNNSLTSVKNTDEAVKLLNPLSNDLAYMRKSMLEGLLENAAYNINRKSADLKFFELGNIYHKKEKYTERRQLAILITGREKAENWIVQKSATDFYHLKGYVNLLLDHLGIKMEEKPLEDERFSEALEIVSGGRTIARLGKVSAQMLKDSDVDQLCYYAEIELESAQELRQKGTFKFADLPRFNKIRRDLALLVDKSVSYSDLHAVAVRSKSAYLRNVNLFDVYEGKNLPEGKKSYAMSIELLSEEKTLEEKEISALMNSLIKSFQKEFSAELRG